MIGILQNIHLALPEIIILCTACIALLLHLIFNDKFQNLVLNIAGLGLVLAMLLTTSYFGNYETILFKGAYISDDLGQIMKLFILLTVLFAFFYSNQYLIERQIPRAEYYIIALFSTLGMMILVSAYSLLTLYMGLELLSLPLYAMTAIRRMNADASEASVKYFIMGALASGFILYGMSLLYGATGKLNLHDIANVLTVSQQQHSALIAFALVMLIAGSGFKLAAVPFHMWAPDVYQGAPTPVTLFISAAPKIAGLGLLLRLLTIALLDDALQWQPILIVMSILSVAIGNVLAVAQDNIKRLLAYSAISHTGYALFGIASATSAGYSAALYYMLVYAMTSVAAFGLITLLSVSGQEIESVNDLRGLNKRNPWLAFLFMIVMFSMAGVPPMVGFFTKLMVLKSLVDVHLTEVALVGLLFAVVGAYYYLRIVKVMYFDEAQQDAPIHLGLVNTTLFSVNTLALLYFGLFPSALLSACIAVFVK